MDRVLVGSTGDPNSSQLPERARRLRKATPDPCAVFSGVVTVTNLDWSKYVATRKQTTHSCNMGSLIQYLDFLKCTGL